MLPIFMYQARSTFNSLGPDMIKEKKFPEMFRSVERSYGYFQQKSSISLSSVSEKRVMSNIFTGFSNNLVWQRIVEYF